MLYSENSRERHVKGLSENVGRTQIFLISEIFMYFFLKEIFFLFIIKNIIVCRQEKAKRNICCDLQREYKSRLWKNNR